MAFDEQLADRIRQILADQPGLTEKRLFGGLAFLLNGHMAVVARRTGGLMVRLSHDDHDILLAEPGTATMIMRGRPMRGWLVVDDPADLATWVRRGRDYALTLPPK